MVRPISSECHVICIHIYYTCTSCTLYMYVYSIDYYANERQLVMNLMVSYLTIKQNSCQNWITKFLSENLRVHLQRRPTSCNQLSKKGIKLKYRKTIHHLKSLVLNYSHFLTLHFGHTKPLMFSTTPNIGRFTLRQKLISFLTSNKETS